MIPRVWVSAVVVLIALPACGSGSQSSSSASAFLTIYHPSADVRPSGESSFLPGHDHEPLVVNDTVRTDPSGFAEIDYPDGSLTRLDVNTIFTVTKLVDTPGHRGVSAELDVGRAWNRVVAVTGSGGFSESTPDATATVRGTAFAVACDRARACRFVVFDGSVQVRTISGEVVVIAGTAGHGQEVDVAADGTPTTPFPASPIGSDPWIEKNTGLDSARATPTPSSSSSPPGLPGTIVFLTKPPTSQTALLDAMDEMNPDGTGVRLLPVGDALCCIAPALSPDGNLLVFTGEGTLDVADADGTHDRSLVPQTALGIYSNPTWSPSGDQIAFVSSGGSGQSAEIDVVNADGTDRHRVLQGPEVNPDGGLTWSPEGTELAFAASSGTIEAVTISGGEVRAILGPETSGFSSSTEEVGTLSWAPAQQIVFSEVNSSDTPPSGIQVINGDGSGLRSVLQGAYSSPSWGPDGVHFVAIRDGKHVVVATTELGVQDTIGPSDAFYAQWGGPPG